MDKKLLKPISFTKENLAKFFKILTVFKESQDNTNRDILIIKNTCNIELENIVFLGKSHRYTDFLKKEQMYYLFFKKFLQRLILKNPVNEIYYYIDIKEVKNEIISI